MFIYFIYQRLIFITMYIKVRQVSSNNEIIVNIPKMVLVNQLKKLVYNNLNIKTDSQILIYKGKQVTVLFFSVIMPNHCMLLKTASGRPKINGL